MTDPLTWLAAGPGLALAGGSMVLAFVAIARKSRLYAVLALTTCALIVPAGGLGWALALSRAFEATSRAEPSVKASLLADGISSVMNGVAVSFAAVLLAALIALFALYRTWSRPLDAAGPAEQRA